jgi:hypothetical protein
MSAPASKLNLRPQEKRLLAFVGIVVFIVLNIWLVWPHFGDWTLIKARQERAQKTYQSYQREITKTSGYRVRLRELESAGSSVLPEEQALDLVRTIDGYAQSARLNVIQTIPRARDSAGGPTNRFFEEQSVTLHATSGNEELVNFLVSLTSTNSLIRVKDLSVKLADASGTRLDANMTLIASYQRKTPAKGQPATPATIPSPADASKTAPPKGTTAKTTTRTNRPPASMTATNAAAKGPSKAPPPASRITNAPARKP